MKDTAIPRRKQTITIMKCGDGGRDSTRTIITVAHICDHIHQILYQDPRTVHSRCPYSWMEKKLLLPRSICTLSSSLVLLTICFVDARKQYLSSRAFIALLNAFMNCTISITRNKKFNRIQFTRSQRRKTNLQSALANEIS